MTQKRILVVDDEQDLCEILLYNLKAAGFQAETAYSGEEAMEKEPSMSVTVPFEVPATTTPAPMTGPIASETTPVAVRFWAEATHAMETRAAVSKADRSFLNIKLVVK